MSGKSFAAGMGVGFIGGTMLGLISTVVLIAAVNISEEEKKNAEKTSDTEEWFEELLNEHEGTSNEN